VVHNIIGYRVCPANDTVGTESIFTLINVVYLLNNYSLNIRKPSQASLVKDKLTN